MRGGHENKTWVPVVAIQRLNLQENPCGRATAQACCSIDAASIEETTEEPLDPRLGDHAWGPYKDPAPQSLTSAVLG